MLPFSLSASHLLQRGSCLPVPTQDAPALLVQRQRGEHKPLATHPAAQQLPLACQRVTAFGPDAKRALGFNLLPGHLPLVNQDASRRGAADAVWRVGTRQSPPGQLPLAPAPRPLSWSSPRSWVEAGLGFTCWGTGCDAARIALFPRARSPSQPHGLFAVTLLRWAGCWGVNNSLLRAPAAPPHPQPGLESCPWAQRGWRCPHGASRPRSTLQPLPKRGAPAHPPVMGMPRGPGHAIIILQGNKSCCTPACPPPHHVCARTCADAHARLHSRAAPCQGVAFGVAHSRADGGELPSTRVCKHAGQPQAVYPP